MTEGQLYNTGTDFDDDTWGSLAPKKWITEGVIDYWGQLLNARLKRQQADPACTPELRKFACVCAPARFGHNLLGRSKTANANEAWAPLEDNKLKAKLKKVI